LGGCINGGIAVPGNILNKHIDKLYTMIAFKDVIKSFQTPFAVVEVLKKISFTVPTGGVVAVIGPSGSGKTTLLSLAAGLEGSDSGEVTMAGVLLSEASEQERTAFRLENIGFVFQGFELIPTLAALENVMVPAELKGDTSCSERAKKLLVEVGLGHRLEHLPAELSGGERQRVAIARAFINQPKILLADEPTGNLDLETGENIIELLFELNEKHQTTLLIATHNMALAERCQQILEFNSTGAIVERARV
jgi:putative ABC transport system ATP-binding protein